MSGVGVVVRRKDRWNDRCSKQESDPGTAMSCLQAFASEGFEVVDALVGYGWGLCALRIASKERHTSAEPVAPLLPGSPGTQKVQIVEAYVSSLSPWKNEML